MPRIEIPNTPFDLCYRVSAPSLEEGATNIDTEYETILYFHPYWVDSFYFYPQFDDPALNEHYNLIAFDAPAHGSTIVEEMSAEPVTWVYLARLVKDALVMLGVPSVHVVGSTMGCCPAMHFASKYPEMTRTLLMCAPPALEEASNWSLTFSECMHILINAVKNNDPEPLDAITSVIFDYNATSHSSKVIKSLEEEYIQLIRSRLISGALNGDKTVPILISLAFSRKQLLSLEEAVEMKPPILIIQGTNEGWEENDDQWAKMLEETNGLHQERYGTEAQAKRIVLDDLPRWMTLTSSDIINPIIKRFISTGSSKEISSLPEFEIDRSSSTTTTMKMISRTRRRSSVNPPRSRQSRSQIEVPPHDSVKLNPHNLVTSQVKSQHDNEISDKSEIQTCRSGKSRNPSIDVNVHVDVVTKID